MAYGFEVNNEFGVPVLEYDRVLYIKENGLTQLGTDSFNDSKNEADSQGISNTSPNRRSSYNGAEFPFRFHYSDAGLISANEEGQVTPPVGRSYVLNNRAIFLPDLSRLTLTDTVFYQVGTRRLYQHNEYIVDLPGFPLGMFSVAKTAGGARLPYRVASTEPPAMVADTDYGMQVRNAAGEVTFDSRYPLFSVVEAFLIKDAAINDILFDNETRVLTLRKPMPNCWISAPFLSSYHIQSDLDTYVVEINQTANDQITLSRAKIADNPTPRTFTQDLILYVGRDM